MKMTPKKLFHTTRAAAVHVVLLVTTLFSLTALASVPTIDFETVSTGYVYQGTESRDDLATVISGSPLILAESLSAASTLAKSLPSSGG